MVEPVFHFNAQPSEGGSHFLELTKTCTDIITDPVKISTIFAADLDNIEAEAIRTGQPLNSLLKSYGYEA